MSDTPPLKEAHRLRRLLKDLDSKIEQAPRQLAIQQAKLAKQEENLKEAHETIKRLALEAREKEGSVKATLQQIVKYEKQLAEAAVKKEYEALKKEIADERAVVAKLEDEILATLGLGEQKTAELPAVEKATQKARADFAQWEKDLQERLMRFTAEKTRAHEELKVVEATFPAEARVVYDRLIPAKGIDSIASVTGRTCSACYVEVTSQMLGELGRGVFMLCKNCGRMLYREA